MADFRLIDYHLSRILPTLVKLGFTETPAKKTRGGCPFVVDIGFNIEQMPTGMQKATLYHNDCYPRTSKDEAVLHVWNGFGSDSRVLAKQIADALTRDGVHARATTYKKYNVVAFDAADWLNVECAA